VEERTQELLESELKFRTFVENADDWERWDAPDRCVLYSSPSCERITGYESAYFQQDPARLDRIIHPGDFSRWRTHYEEVHPAPDYGGRPAGPRMSLELRIFRRDGEERWVEHSCHPIFDTKGQYQGRRVKIRDITERKQAEKAREHLEGLARFNRTQKAIIECNQAIIRARDEAELLHALCRMAMKVQGVYQAWVVLAGPGAGSPFKPVTGVGFIEEEWLQLQAAWSGIASAQSSAGIALCTGQVCLQPKAFPLGLLPEGRAQGVGASMALPLLGGEQPFGALVLDAFSPDAFEDEAVQMLLELANNLSIGILELRIRADRDQALRQARRLADQLRSLTMELAQTEQRERRRLALVLHDHLQQLLVGATFSLETLAGAAVSGKAQGAFGTLADTLREAIQVTRLLSVELCPPVVHEKGLGGALEWLAEQFQKNHGLKVVTDLEAEGAPPPEPVRMFLFEAVRELLFNVVKHAQVREAVLRLRLLPDANVGLTVEDRGKGFDPACLSGDAFPSEGLGLFSLREKLGYLKGRLEIVSRPGEGCRVTLEVGSGGRPEDRDSGR